MLNGIQKFLQELTTNPKRIFLVDALGALLTAISLFVIVVQLEYSFGIPSKVIYIMSGTAFSLFIYSISCHLLIKLNWKPFLGVIIACNSIYSLVSIGLLIKHSEKLTELGWIYFMLELTVILIIVIVEYSAYTNLGES